MLYSAIHLFELSYVFQFFIFYYFFPSIYNVIIDDLKMF